MFQNCVEFSLQCLSFDIKLIFRVVYNSVEINSFVVLLVEKLKFGILWVSGERNDVSNVLESGDKKNQSFESKTETGVWDGSVSAKIQVPPHLSGVETHLFATSLENIHAMLTLRSTNDFTNLWNQNVRGSDSLFILVQLHVKGLNVFRIIRQYNRFLVDLFTQVSFVFRRKINSPNRFFFEYDTIFFDSLLKNFNSFGIRQSLW